MQTVKEPTTEERILDAAAALFAEKGYHGTNMRELAELVGVRAGSLYNHFPGKQDVLHRIAHDVMAELLEGARAAVAAQPEPRGRLRAWVTWHVGYHVANRRRAKVADDQLHALEPERRAQVVAVRDAYERLIRDLVAAGRDAEGWRVADLAVVANAIGTMCTAVTVWYRDGGRLGPDEVAALYADLVLAMLEGGA